MANKYDLIEKIGNRLLQEERNAYTKKAWFPAKEELIYFENLEKKQGRIYPDAADYGVKMDEIDRDEARKNLMILMKTYGYKYDQWGTKGKDWGTETQVFIPIEQEEPGAVSGELLVVWFNRDHRLDLEFLTIQTERKILSDVEIEEFEKKIKAGVFLW